MFHPSISDGLDGGPMITPVGYKDKTGNQINTIYPYRTQAGWAFDDSEVALQGEPFIAGIPEIIDSIVGDKDKFTAHISHSPIPNFTGHLKKLSEKDIQQGGFMPETGWYELEGTNMIGWLCPATLKYFKDYPDSIYFKIE